MPLLRRGPEQEAGKGFVQLAPPVRWLRPLLSATALWLAASAHAQQSLLDLYLAARSHDSSYQSALAQYQADLASAAQTRAGLLPQVELGAELNRGQQHSHGPQAQRFDGDEAASIVATQPLYRPANLASYQQGQRKMEAAQAVLTQVEQDLIVRLSQAYFNVLASQDSLTFVRAQKVAVAEQLAAAQRNFEVGTTTVTDSREAQAQYDLVKAQEIAAVNELRVRQLELALLSGVPGAQPQPLATPVSLPPLAWEDPNQLVERAQNVHPRLREAEIARDSADLETRKAQAGQLPTIDASLGYEINHRRHGSSISNPARAREATIGVVLRLPLYAGGSLRQRIRETQSLADKARIDLEGVRRQIEQDARTAYLNQLSNTSSVHALEAAEASSLSALEANQLGYEVGVRINIDVLNAQSQLYQTKRDLAQARYNVLLGDLLLRQAAGQLSTQDLEQLNQRLLDASRPSAAQQPGA